MERKKLVKKPKPFFHTSKIEELKLSFFLTKLGICDVQSQETFLNQGSIRKVKKLSVLINDWENNIGYWEQCKQSKVLSRKCVSFHINCK